MDSKQFNELHRITLESAVNLVQASIENSQRIVAIQTDVANMLFQAHVDNARAISSINDGQETVSLRTQHTRNTMRTLLNAAQEISEIGKASRIEFSRLMSAQGASDNNDIMKSFQAFFGTLPGQNTTLVDAMQQAMHQTNKALEQFAEATAAAFERSDHGRTKKK